MASFEIDTLKGVEFDALLAAFNDAFSSYAVPMQLTAERLAHMIRARDVDLARSFGVFDDRELRAFLLNGFRTMEGVRTAYDSGTGVASAFQGQGLGRRLMEHALERLANEGIERYVLEVLTVNEGAVALYEKLGFETARTLHSFDGSPVGEDTSVAARPIEPGWNERVASLHCGSPSWQNADEAVENLAENCILLELEGAAFGVLERPTGNLMQFGFDEGREEAARTILRAAARETEHEKLRCLNVDADAKHVLALLEDEDFAPIVSQYEMVRAIV